jgi:hypothetical protein
VHSPFPVSGAKGIVFWSGDEAAAKGYARRRTEGGLPTFVLDDTLYGRMLVRLWLSTLSWRCGLRRGLRRLRGKRAVRDACSVALQMARLFPTSILLTGYLRHG